MTDDHRAQASDGGQPPASLAAAGNQAGDHRPRGRATGRDYAAAGHYAPAERLALIVRAICDGVSATSERCDIPRSTLTSWLKDWGGIGAVRAYLQVQTLADFLRLERALYEEVIRRLEAGKVPERELWKTMRKLIDMRHRQALSGAPGAGGGAQPPAAYPVGAITVTARAIGDSGEENHPEEMCE